MKYESLGKIYYKRLTEHVKIYNERFNSPLTRHFDFQIQEYNHRNKYPAFFCYTEEFAVLMKEIYKKHEDLNSGFASRTASSVRAVHLVQRCGRSSSDQRH